MANTNLHFCSMVDSYCWWNFGPILKESSSSWLLNNVTNDPDDFPETEPTKIGKIITNVKSEMIKSYHDLLLN